MNESRFFVFDGVDGAGKTTQIERFVAWLESRGHSVVVCREPGTSELGEQIRAMLLTSDDLAIGNRAEMLLYMASRAQLIEQIVLPSLAAGKTVVSDRFLLANVVYQGHAGGLPTDQIWQVGEIATRGVSPTKTILLDLDPEAAERRRSAVGGADRMERRGLEYFKKVRQGFLTEATRDPDAIVVIDAAGSADQVTAAIQNAIEPFVGEGPFVGEEGGQ